MSDTASSATVIGCEVLAKLTAPASEQTSQAINSPVRPHSHPSCDSLDLCPCEALAQQLSALLLCGHLAQALQPLLTYHLHQFRMNPSSRIYTETTKEGKMSIDLDVYKAITGKEFHGRKIPVYTNDEKYDVISKTAEDTKIAALHEEINFLKQCQSTQETIFQSEIVSLKVSLATAQSKIWVLESQHIAPLQVAVHKLDEENKILRWEHNRLLAMTQEKQNEDIKKSKKGSGWLMPGLGKGKGVDRGFLGLLIAILLVAVAMVVAMTQGGSGHRAALGEWLAEVGRAVEVMAENVNGSWGTLGCQGVDGRAL